ncbi:hypothetical protein Tco_0856671 [Tanacetum coccineum]|uniref:DUF4283 domain-containing protein n=1 Tax=Tanacetum coccineum TaxID=301880 RepID=A0ABQ5B899_9ASTR
MIVLTLRQEPDAPMINNFDELNEDECFDPGGGEIDVEDDYSFTFDCSDFEASRVHAARLGCAETKVVTWDDLAFKLIILGWNVKHRILQNVDPWKWISKKRTKLKPKRQNRAREQKERKRKPLNDVTKPTKLNPNGDIGGLNSVEPECTTGLNMSNASQVGSFAETPNTILKKEEIKLAPIWVKLHHVPIVAYSEVSADKDLMESIVVTIPLSNGKGHSFATIDIAYEWKPPRCSSCAIFDHVIDQCPKNLKVEVVASEKEDGFTEVKRKKSKAKQNLKCRYVDGVRLNKPPVNFYYRKVEKGETSKKVEEVDTPTVSKGTSNEGYEQVARKVNADKNSSKPRTDVLEKDSVVLKNFFGSLGEELDIKWELLFKRPWCILGDFNVALFLHDSSACDHANFKPYRISDHSPLILNIPTLTKPKPKPFKFYNIITSNENFAQLRDQLDHVQRRLDMDPFNVDICEEEASTMAAFNKACIMEEKFLKQKAKIDWLQEDQNVATDMIRNVTRQEVKSSLFSMGNEKSLSPNGFTVAFFKESWDIVADDLVAAICEFFTNGFKCQGDCIHVIAKVAWEVCFLPMMREGLECEVRDWYRDGLSSSSKVWNQVKLYAGLSTSSPIFSQIMSIVVPFAARKSSRSIIAKLVIAASAYFIWQEQNWRLFKNKKRTTKQVVGSLDHSID